MRMRVLTHTNKGKLISIADEVTKLISADKATDTIMPAYPCDGERLIVVVDPMLATGGSAVDAINSIKAHGGKNIKFMCIIASPEGIAAMHAAHPDVNIYVAGEDECLNDHGYIVPGLGDAGDRIFGTL